MAVPTQETKGIRIHSVKASREDASIASQNNFLMPGKNLIYGLMGFLLVYAIVRSLVAAAERPFWFDELMTLTVSAQGTWNAILTTLRRALDAQPPLFYMIEHFASGLTRNKEIALRLPSVLAFPCTLTCVFIYVKRRGGEAVQHGGRVHRVWAGLLPTRVVAPVDCTAGDESRAGGVPSLPGCSGDGPFWLGRGGSLFENTQISLAGLGRPSCGCIAPTSFLEASCYHQGVLRGSRVVSLPILLHSTHIWRALSDQ